MRPRQRRLRGLIGQRVVFTHYISGRWVDRPVKSDGRVDKGGCRHRDSFLAHPAFQGVTATSNSN